MNVRNCRKCGRVFNYFMGPQLCMACREAMDQKFQEVKTYIREHGGAGINEVSEACDVEVSQIHQWLREERLELVEGSGIVLHCETCGAVIMSGRFCQKCKGDLTRGLRAAASRPAPAPAPEKPKSTKDNDRMRFL